MHSDTRAAARMRIRNGAGFDRSPAEVTLFDREIWTAHCCRFKVTTTHLLLTTLLINAIVILTLFGVQDSLATESGYDYYPVVWGTGLANALLWFQYMLHVLSWRYLLHQPQTARSIAQCRAAVFVYQSLTLNFLILSGVLELIYVFVVVASQDDRPHLRYHLLAAGLLSLAVAISLRLRQLYRWLTLYRYIPNIGPDDAEMTL